MEGGERIDLASGSVAWGPCHIGTNVVIGADVSIGCLAHVGRDVSIGEGSRIQGGAYIADGTTVKEGVFIGPNATILNDKYPPSRDSNKWEFVTIEEGAVIGGGATILPGIRIGTQAVVAAGAVLTKDIPAGEVWVGNPAMFHMHRSEYEGAR
ncbi:MAG: acyltransferase [Candidatus Thalassarchaeaceae archaeon]|jgi:acetyltransferase-like isoleucine patch superfamily enzyme|nr:acyltransferase [Candidatus Thalassarchaeaceae archaeon]